MAADDPVALVAGFADDDADFDHAPASILFGALMILRLLPALELAEPRQQVSALGSFAQAGAWTSVAVPLSDPDCSFFSKETLSCVRASQCMSLAL